VRLVTSLLTAPASILAGRHPRQGLSSAMVAGLAVGVFRLLRQGQWMAEEC